MKNAIIRKTLVCLAALLLALTSVCPALAETLLIGVPDDATNLSRAIKLLETAGFIEVDPAAGFTPEIKDVTKYIYDIEIMPVAANTLPATLDDYAASTINSTYATPFGLKPSRDALLTEKQEEGVENPFINVIVARTEEKDSEIYKTILEAYQTQLVAEFMLVYYAENYFPAFPYDAEAEFTVTPELAQEIVSYESPREGKTVVKVGICSTGNDQWKAVQKVLDDEGANIYIELVEFDAYTLPNEALNSGEIDLNAFQHKAFLQNEIDVNGYDLTIIGDTLIAPLSLYSKNFESLDALKDAAGLLE